MHKPGPCQAGTKPMQTHMQIFWPNQAVVAVAASTKLRQAFADEVRRRGIETQREKIVDVRGGFGITDDILEAWQAGIA